MDCLEIMSDIRNITGLETEEDIGVQELLRHINNGYKRYILPKITLISKRFLTVKSVLADQTGETISRPADAQEIISVLRGNYECIFVDEKDEYKIGDYTGIVGDVQLYPADDSLHPLCMDRKSELRIWPDLDETDVEIKYRRTAPNLIFGKGTVSGSALALNDTAMPVDDYYNDMQIALYTQSGASLTLHGIYLISDYSGSTRMCTLASEPGVISVFYALKPFIPDDFHPLITDATLIELIKCGKYKGNINTFYMTIKDEVIELTRAYRSLNS